jgi:hypothetical protein
MNVDEIINKNKSLEEELGNEKPNLKQTKVKRVNIVPF